MINLNNLIELLPYKYKQKDTYKFNGKGILERFLDICGNYLSDVITPDIENELDLIDLNNIPEMYLNYLWEFLGEIPFAYGISIDKVKFDKYYDGLKTKEELLELSKIWTISKKGPVVLNETKVRNILKFAITLIKIRGTKLFFETLFKLYGFDCIITDPILEEGNTDGQYTSALWYNRIPRYDIDSKKYDSNVKYDIDSGCNQCIQVNFDISSIVGFADINGEYFRDSLGIIFSGSYNGLIDLYTGITDWNDQVINMASTQEEYIRLNEPLIFSGNLPASLKEFVAFRKMVRSFFDRYLPFNVTPHITYQGIEVDDKINIIIEQLDDITDIGNGVILQDVLPVLHYRITVNSLWEYSDTRWHVGDSNIWHNSGDILEVSVPGEYVISTKNGEDSETLTIIKPLLKSYYSAICGDSGLEFKPSKSTIYIEVYDLLYKDRWDSSDRTVVVDTIVLEPKLIKGTYSSVIRNNDHYIYTFTTNRGGVHGAQDLVFSVSNGRDQISLKLTAEPERVYGSIYSNTGNYEEGCNLSFNLNSNWGLYTTDDLVYFTLKQSPDWSYHIGDSNPSITNLRPSTLNFEIVKNLNVGEEYLDRVNSIIIENDPEGGYQTKWDIYIEPKQPVVKNIVLLEGNSFSFDDSLPKVSVRLDITGTDASMYSKKLYVYDSNDVLIKTINDGTITSYIFEEGDTLNPGTYIIKTEEESGTGLVTTTFTIKGANQPQQITPHLYISPTQDYDQLQWDTDWSIIPNKLSTNPIVKFLPVTIKLKLYYNNFEFDGYFNVAIYDITGPEPEDREFIRSISIRGNTNLLIDSSILQHDKISFEHPSGVVATLEISGE